MAGSVSLSKGLDLGNIAKEINSNVSTDMHDARRSIVMAIPDIHAIQTQYNEWGESFKMEKTIRGVSLPEWMEHFHVDVKLQEGEDLTPEWIRNKITEIHDKLDEASKYLSTAQIKYDEIVIDGSIRYLANYEDMIDPNGTTEVGEIISRNISKEKIKMIAESKNRNVVAAAMIAKQEVEFFQSVMGRLTHSFNTVRAISSTLYQDIKLGGFH